MYRFPFQCVLHLVPSNLYMPQVSVMLTAGDVPLLEGALDCAKLGIASSLLPQNLSAAALVSDGDAAAESPVWPLLFDPQTAGGLLAG